MDYFHEDMFACETPYEVSGLSAIRPVRRPTSDSLAVNVSIMSDVLHEKENHAVHELLDPAVLDRRSCTEYCPHGWHSEATFDIPEGPKGPWAASAPSENESTADHHTRPAAESSHLPTHISLPFRSLNDHERTLRESRRLPQDDSFLPLAGMGFWTTRNYAPEGRRADQHGWRENDVAQCNSDFRYTDRNGERLQDRSEDRAESISLLSSITSSSTDHLLFPQNEPGTLYSLPLLPSDLGVGSPATALLYQALQLSDIKTQYLTVKREVDRVRSVNRSVPQLSKDDERQLHAKYLQALKHYEEALERNVGTVKVSLKRRATPQLKSELQELKAVLEKVRRRRKYEKMRRLVAVVGWIATS